MKKKKQHDLSSNPLLRRLETALKNLEEFINYNESKEILHLPEVKQEKDLSSKSLLEKTKHLVRGIIQSAISDQLKISQQLVQSVETLKKHYKLIEKLLTGSLEEKKWAEWALSVIKRYNCFIDSIQSKPKSLSQRVTKYVYEKSGISINEDLVKHKICVLTDPSFYFNSSHASPEEERWDLSSEKITSFLRTSCISEHLSKQETDIFRMKTISLSNHSDLPDTLRNCLKNMIWSSPFHGMITSSSEESNLIISIVQTLIPFPGEVIKVRGSFRRDKNSLVSSVPIQESFQLITAVSQTGFPQPSQHTGFALSHSLIPESPLHAELVPNFSQALEQKQAIALELLPQGNLNETAKQILKKKKEIFENNLQQHLDRHRNLSMTAILQAPYEFLEKENSEKIIQCFYDQLAKSLLPFRYLSQTNLILNQLFLTKPWADVQSQWLENHHENLFHHDPKIRQQTCEKMINEKILHACAMIQEQFQEANDELEKGILAYLNLMGKVIGSAGKSLMLQMFSEKMGFSPPLLRHFELSLQTILFRQLLAFHHELHDPNEISNKTMLDEINSEIDILKQMETDDSLTNQSSVIVQELEVYFNSQFYQSRNP